LLLASDAFCGEGPSVAIVEDWSAVFGGRATTFHVSVASPVGTRGRLLWRLAVNRRTVRRGEKAVAPTPAAPARAALRLEIPEVREGVSIQAVLTASFAPEGSSEAIASIERPLWIFSPDPFAHRKQWLEGLKISLFDPENTTGAIMKEAGIPFRPVANADAMAGAGGVVVVGEGVSFREYRGLPAALLRAAAAGAAVVCLAPAGGEFGFPGHGEADSGQAPDAMAFRRQGIIRELDKRLDATAWPPDGAIVRSSMKLVGQRGPVVGEIVKGDEGWPWVRLDYRDAGTLMIAGFPIMAKWHDGPSPRYLFARLLEVSARCGGKADETQKESE